MCAGQGGQYFQMGQKFYQDNLTFYKWMHKLNDIAQVHLNESILSQIYQTQHPATEVFDKTIYTHPALFMTQYALYQVLLENQIEPDYVLGSSMGEFVSAAIAGVASVEEILDALINQAKILDENCAKGAMIAILKEPDYYFDTPEIHERGELAGISFKRHFVVSGTSQSVEEIASFVRTAGVIHQVLPVTQGFHSQVIEPAAAPYQAWLAQQSYQDPMVPTISCVNACINTKLPQTHFWDAIRQPIQFKNTIEALEENDGYIYVDLSPSGTLANFVKNNFTKRSQSTCVALFSPLNNDSSGLDKLKQIVADDCKKKLKNAMASTNYNAKGTRSPLEATMGRNEDSQMKVYIFPGQGSQFKGMGKNLFADFATLVEKADSILGYSVEELCVDDPQRRLNQTQYTQPALFVVNALSYLKKMADTETPPDFLAGHSVGEFSALFASGAIDFETGIKLVRKRGELMSKAPEGAMAAVIGLNQERIEALLKEHNLTAIDIANYNAPTQVVLSGLKADIGLARDIFTKANASYVPLNVSAAFHSRYMERPKQEFAAYLSEFNYGEAKIPVISNISARPYAAAEIQHNLIEQITGSVRWVESICYLMSLGKVEFEEVGPGTVLTKLVKKIESEAVPLRVNKVQKVETVVTKSEEKLVVKLGGGGTIKAEPITEKDDAVNNKPKTIKSAAVEKLSTKPSRAIQSITAESLGNVAFKKDYNTKYAYVSGAMYRGTASKELVVRMGKAGMLGFLGTGGLKLSQVESDIQYIQKTLDQGQSYGMNLLNNINDAQFEMDTVKLYLKYGIKYIEAAAFMQNLSMPLVKYRLDGISKNADGSVNIANKIIAKVSRPEVAEAFMSPPPERLIKKLLEAGEITPESAELAKLIPMADDICAEADSGGHTDGGIPYTLLPAMQSLRQQIMSQFNYPKEIRIGAAGGIGAPESMAAAFIMGADFVLTGSINHCTVEAGTSDSVKDLLQQMNIQDTEYAPAGDMFELGAKVQVLKKGLFFPLRANKLYEVYQRYNSLDEIDEKTKKQIQEKYFKKTFDQVYEETKASYLSQHPEELKKAERNPKHKMALVFRWYFYHSSQLAFKGDEEKKVDYQVHIGPALGAFNQWVKGTELEDWRNRHVDEIGMKLLQDTASLLNHRFQAMQRVAVV